MADRKAALAGFLLLTVSLAALAGAQDEVTPSLEFNPASEVVPLPRQKPRSQPQILFARTVGGFGIGRGSLDSPVDVIHDDDENYYILDKGNQRVLMYGENDRDILEWGSFGSRDGEFKRPSAIARDSEGRIYVSDTGNHRIQIFNPRGDFVDSFGRLGSTPGKFNEPTDIAFDGEENIYILDAGNGRIQKFTSGHIFEDEWGRFGGGRLGEFGDVVSMAYDDDRLGRLFLLGKGEEEGTCLVQILEINAARREVESSWVADYPERQEEPCVPTRIRLDNRDDYVYILDGENSVLRRFTKEGRYLDSIWEVREPLNRPEGFSIETVKRQLYIADTGNDIVQIFTLR